MDPQQGIRLSDIYESWFNPAVRLGRQVLLSVICDFIGECFFLNMVLFKQERSFTQKPGT